MIILSAPGAGLRGLRGSSAVENLQRALKAYAQTSGNVMADPGSVDGVIGSKTMTAVQAVLPVIAGKINRTLASALQIALPLAAMDPATMERSKQLVEQLAPEMTVALLALTAQTVVSPPTAPTSPATGIRKIPGIDPRFLNFQNQTVVPGASPVMPPAATPDGYPAPMPFGPWYKTWWGLSVIGIGAVSSLILLALLVRK